MAQYHLPLPFLSNLFRLFSLFILSCLSSLHSQFISTRSLLSPSLQGNGHCFVLLSLICLSSNVAIIQLFLSLLQMEKSTLPIELLVRIFNFTNPKDLSNIQLTSKQFNAIVDNHEMPMRKFTQLVIEGVRI